MKSFSAKDVYNFIVTGVNKDLTVLEASYRRKHPNVSKGMMSKNYYALHLILKGSGKLETPDGTFDLKKNDVFVRFPNETIAYYDYPSDPFNYIFVTFHGSVVKYYLARVGITPKNRVVQTTAELTSLFKNMISSCRDYSAISDMISSGLLQLIFAELAKNHVPTVKEDYRPKNNYVNNVLEFIDANLSNPDLTADYAAQFLNLNTDYFLCIFKDVTGIPFSKFIEAKKMNLAASLLLEGKISVSRISEECGYSSPSYFTKVFRANFNQSPRDFMAHGIPEQLSAFRAEKKI